MGPTKKLMLEEAIVQIRIIEGGTSTQNRRQYETIFTKLLEFRSAYVGKQDMLIHDFYESVIYIPAFLRPNTAVMIRNAGIIINIYRVMNGLDFARKAIFRDAYVEYWYDSYLCAYQSWMSNQGKCQNTIRTRIGRIRVFFHFLDTSEKYCLDETTIDDFVSFPKYLDEKKYTSQGKHNILYTLRDLLKCPSVSAHLKCNPLPLFNRMHTNKHERLPSFYSRDEILRVISVIPRDTKLGRQQYAIILLACVYGIRSIDIKDFRIDSIRWTKNTLAFVQRKTKRYVELPLIPEVKWALLDYMQNSRPSSGLPYVFLRMREPIAQFSMDNHFADQIKKLFIKAGVKTDGKHCGLHSLRHSLATALTEMETPLNEVTQILGHSSVTSTLSYIWSDMNHLRIAAEEVPHYGK
jgi:integrase